MNLQLLLHLDVVSYFGLVLLELLLVLDWREVDGHDSTLGHLVYVTFFGRVASGGIDLLHKIKVSLFMNIRWCDVVFLHAHQDFNRSLDVLQNR